MRIVFMGSSEFAVPSLKKLLDNGYDIAAVITQPDREKGRGKKISATPVKILAQELKLDVFQPERINKTESIEKLKTYKADIFVVVAFGQILKEEILNMTPFGAINVHASLLPSYRGAAPIHWAIVNGEKKTGVTTMFLDKGMDTGDMIYRHEIEIKDTDSVGTLHDALKELGADLLIKTLRDIEKGIAPRIAQDDETSSYAPIIKKEDEKINWQRSAQDIYNHIRGFSPWPGTYTLLKDKRLKIYRAGIERAEVEAIPGKVLAADKNGILVATRDNAIRIFELQPEGKARMAASDFIRGYNVIGEILGA